MKSRPSALDGAAKQAFTLLEMLVVVVVVLVMSSMGAVALMSQIPKMKLSAQATVVLKLLRSSRERSAFDKKTWKVRFHQTRRVPSADELFRVDQFGGAYGTHQYVFASPVDAWYQSLPSTDLLPTETFPDLLKNSLPNNNYDAGLPPTIQIVPLLLVTNAGSTPPQGDQFPTDLSTLRLPGIVELESDVRIISINDKPTFSAGGTIYYGDPPNFDQPIPKNPNSNAVVPGSDPPRPAAATPPIFFDDRIADATYSPDGVFRFMPVYPVSPSPVYSDYTITFGNYDAALVPMGSNPITSAIVLDRMTGFPHY